jgi:predicted kinase
MASNKKSLVLLRGIPGSGKTTLAEILNENGKYPVFSIDQYFTDATGNYKFDHLKNHVAYEECRKNTEQEMKKATEKIFVDNTFTLDWEMEPYFILAKENEYKIFVVTVENYHGSMNIHKIPDEQIRKMADKYKVRLV